jgi:hypothetical protein
MYDGTQSNNKRNYKFCENVTRSMTSFSGQDVISTVNLILGKLDYSLLE